MTPITGSPEREAHGRVELSGATMQALIQRAFGLKPYQITGPNWLQDARYDIVAKLPEDASQDDIPEMLQTLLADRFRLAAHHSRELRPVYRLVAGKGGVKMQPVKDPTGRLRVSLGSQARRVAGTVTMVNLIHILAESVDRPIEDGTGLEGSFNVSIEWALADGALDADGSPLPTVFSALQERLGLRLEPHEMPLAVLVVDHLERQPTAN